MFKTPRKKPLDACYLVCKWLTYNEVRRKIAEIKKISRLENGVTRERVSQPFSLFGINWFGEYDDEKVKANLVSEYWDKEEFTVREKVDDRTLRAVLILQVRGRC